MLTLRCNIALRQELGYDGDPAEFAKFHTFPTRSARASQGFDEGKWQGGL
jgi:hypothetical protein